VLHNATEVARIETRIRREGNVITLPLVLSKGWRQGDISWRTSTWDLRRMALGGLLLESLSGDELAKVKIAKVDLALRVKHLGMYGAHAVAKKAGFKKGDILVAFDGITSAMTESQLLAYVLQKTTPGEQLPVTVSRNGKRIDFELKMQ
jgi:hypothetical protein